MESVRGPWMMSTFEFQVSSSELSASPPVCWRYCSAHRAHHLARMAWLLFMVEGSTTLAESIRVMWITEIAW